MIGRVKKIENRMKKKMNSNMYIQFPPVIIEFKEGVFKSYPGALFLTARDDFEEIGIKKISSSNLKTYDYKGYSINDLMFINRKGKLYPLFND
ncbi:hypothetical protein PMZ66_13125 [Clostridium paraputrificum]|uniref:hypothetical protein n=1 Tax=Clostridium paraputrificum TaxID=29363 RepID=UPI00232BBDE8|nr:hypothetical protein [Clostridium paraputrificum]MDB2076553.1 hypothetical protein [Clostridium paraputrificum]MDB2080066.1 hypothetical protein [Clostridium paraputrificum]